MTAEIIYDGKKYWQIKTRFNQNKRRNPRIGSIAVFDMRQLHPQTRAVKNRVNQFIAQHRFDPPGNSPNGGGGAVA